MPAWYIPPPALDPTVLELEPYERAGEIRDGDFVRAFTKSELDDFNNFKKRLQPPIRYPSPGKTTGVISFRVAQSVFDIFCHCPSDNSETPTYLIPYLLSLYGHGDILIGIDGYSAAYVEDGDLVNEACIEVADFFSSIVWSGNAPWSMLNIARDIKVESESFLNHAYKWLLSDAYATKLMKHSFLDLFRCIEHKTLHEVLNKINRDFISKPDATIKSAQKSIDNERNLIRDTLSNQTSVLSGAAQIIRSLVLSNTFMMAVHAREKDIPSDDIGYSAHMLYAVRCAVAHAKAGDLMIERFSDYKAALEKLIPYVEIIALRFSGVELDQSLA